MLGSEVLPVRAGNKLAAFFVVALGVGAVQAGDNLRLY